MSFGLLSMQQRMDQEAIDGKRRVADLENRRDQANDQIESATHQRNMSSAGTGAGLGLAAATTGASGAAMGAKLGSWAGPVGIVGGAAAGYLVSSIFG